ncbi:MAG: hypothetical protein M1829_005732 [Trizodia sp. TS-e1964]|nr:MAG: hypothetical protein M1829_005732 [Trizodia sp. TS-e1964]
MARLPTNTLALAFLLVTSSHARYVESLPSLEPSPYQALANPLVQPTDNYDTSGLIETDSSTPQGYRYSSDYSYSYSYPTKTRSATDSYSFFSSSSSSSSTSSRSSPTSQLPAPRYPTVSSTPTELLCIVPHGSQNTTWTCPLGTACSIYSDNACIGYVALGGPGACSDPQESHLEWDCLQGWDCGVTFEECRRKTATSSTTGTTSTSSSSSSSSGSSSSTTSVPTRIITAEGSASASSGAGLVTVTATASSPANASITAARNTNGASVGALSFAGSAIMLIVMAVGAAGFL